MTTKATHISRFFSTEDVANGTISVAKLSNIYTSNVIEHVNLYFTTQRARDSFSAGTGVSILDGNISIGQPVYTNNSVSFNNLTLTGELRGPSTLVLDPAAIGDDTGTVQIRGNLQVDGTTTTINSTTLTVDDLNIVLAQGAANAAAASGAGINIDGANATLTYASSTDTWNVNKNLLITPGTANGVLYLNGSKVATTGSALTFDGTNLGVGIAVPSTVLHTYGTGPTFERTTTATTSVRNTLNLRTTTTGSAADGFGPFIEFTLTDAETTAGVLGGIAAVRAGADNTGNLLFFTSTTGTNTEQMRLTSTGLGIGTSSPGAKLDVAGTIRSSLQFDNGGQQGATTGLVLGGVGSFYGRVIESSNNLWALGYSSTRTGAVTNAVVWDSSGNLGLGVTPSAWGSIFKASQIGNYGAFVAGRSDSANQLHLGTNSYYNGTNWIYTNTSSATRYVQASGAHEFYTAASGTAGNAITFTQAMTLSASGNLGIGTTSPAARLYISGPSNDTYGQVYINATSGDAQLLFNTISNGRGVYVDQDDSNKFKIYTGYGKGTGREVVIDNEGNLTTDQPSNISYYAATGSTRLYTVYREDKPTMASGSSSWVTLKRFVATKTGRIRIRASMYITSGPYYFAFRLYDNTDGVVVWNSSTGGNYSSYADGANFIHAYSYYTFSIPNLIAGHEYRWELTPSDSSGLTPVSYAQNLWCKEFVVTSESPGETYGSPLLINQSIGYGTEDVNYDYHPPLSSVHNGQVFTGTTETFLGWYYLRANSRFLDIKTNISSSDFMFFFKATGYLYNNGVFNEAMRGGYCYTNNSVINQNTSTPTGSNGFYNLYRDSGGYLCAKLDSGISQYTEGVVGISLGTFGPLSSGVHIINYVQNDSTSNYYT